MPWSWRMGRFAGIDVYIHFTFFILLGAWLLALYARQGAATVQVLYALVFFLALFGCVVLHEFGHALAARRYGVRTEDITLLPIGGVARLERIPKEPYQELVVALAGPAVNVGIAGILYLILTIAGRPLEDSQHPVLGLGENLMADLLRINIWLVLFNMIPAFPMDGGRVLRAMLAFVMQRVTATRIATLLGQIIALGFAVIGLLYNPILLFIALFVFIGAQQEYQTARWEAAVEGLTAGDAMVTRFRTLNVNDPLQRAVALLLEGSQHDFPVLDDEYRVVGVLLRQDLIAALSRNGGAELVSTAMRPATNAARPEEPLTGAFERMQTARLPILPIFDAAGKLLGLLTLENITEVIMVRNALENARTAPA